MSDAGSSKQGESTGLLRRMFRRVSNPKHPDNEHGSDNLSSEKKTQMLIHKQRNDLERRREFAELRELHAQRLLKESGAESQLSGNEMSKGGTRQAETLSKINQLESQMASRWSKQQEAGAQATKISGQNTASSQAQGDTLQGIGAPQTPSPLDLPGVMGAVDEDSRRAELSELADPALEEVGVLFASNEDEQVEQNLKAMLERDSPQRNKRVTWLVLMDFYRATGQQAAYEALAMEYMTLFAESAPQWQVFDPALLKRQRATQASAIGAAVYWKAPAVLDEAGGQDMQEKFNLDDPKIIRTMDWGAIKEVTPEGAKIVLSVLEKQDQPGITLQIAAMSTVMAILAAKTKAKGSQGDEILWQLRLELLRLFDTTEGFDMEAMEFCLAYEVSPPAWIKPKCKTEDLDATDHTEEEDPISTRMNHNSTMIGDFSTEFYGQNVKSPLRLRGAYKGTMAAELKKIDSKIFETGGFLSINCEGLVRVDFSAAGDLLNWIAEKSARGYSVNLVKVHRLVALFFIVMGISMSARVSLRRD